MKHINDEHLSNYISGLSDSEEESAVLDALSHDDESLNDFINIVAAIEVQKDSEQQKKSSKRPVWQYWSAAAVIAILIVGAIMFAKSPSAEIDHAPVFASSDSIDQDTIQDVEINYIVEQ